MLNRNNCKSYNAGVLQRQKEVTTLAASSTEANSDRHEGRPAVHTVSAADFLSNKKLSEEIFGPASLIVLCKSAEELKTALQSLEGQLTATLHATDADENIALPVIELIAQKAGRVIYGGYPTGVEVCHSMHHGGPMPSTTDGRFTSVGTAAIYRFVRPVAYQDFPDRFLPAALQNSNPLNILRLVDGEWTNKNLQ
jgi:2,5-dioxopentanoate dehydrogenase